jgi:hypothetical protein
MITLVKDAIVRSKRSKKLWKVTEINLDEIIVESYRSKKVLTKKIPLKLFARYWDVVEKRAHQNDRL